MVLRLYLPFNPIILLQFRVFISVSVKKRSGEQVPLPLHDWLDVLRVVFEVFRAVRGKLFPRRICPDFSA
jgi:hypothetical protein